jgi:hypothetical protein
MLSVVMLNVIRLSVIMLSFVLPSVEAPIYENVRTKRSDGKRIPVTSANLIPVSMTLLEK